MRKTPPGEDPASKRVKIKQEDDTFATPYNGQVYDSQPNPTGSAQILFTHVRLQSCF